MGVRNSAHSLVKLINPFAGESLLVTAATHPGFIELMREILFERQQAAILLTGDRRGTFRQSETPATP